MRRRVAARPPVLTLSRSSPPRKDDLFQKNPNRRLMIDGYLTVDPHYMPGFKNTVGPGGR